MDSLEIYERQKELPLNRINRIMVVGLGGIGSWMALSLALVGTRELYLIDNDIIEMSNLNRTPYRIQDIGKHKVEAITELIYERRQETLVVPIQGKIEDNFSILQSLKFDYIIDCRDNLKNSNILRTMQSQYIKLGYDGISYTIDTCKENKTFGEEEAVRYRTVPSFLGTPLYIAALILNVIALNKEGIRETIITKEVEKNV